MPNDVAMQKTHMWQLLAILASGALGLAGCTLETWREDVDERSVELDSNWTDWSVDWNQGEREKVMAPELTHVCVLTKVKGRFNGYGEKVYLTIEPRDEVQRWILRGESQSSGIGGSAKCFKKTGFLAYGENRWNSPEWSIRRGSGCGSATVPTTSWNGHATTFLSGLSGKFEGGAERVRIVQSTSVSEPSRAIAEGCQGAMEIKARAFFAGDMATGIARYAGATFDVSTMSSNEGAESSNQVRMVASNSAMCHLVWVGGDFGGGAESVEIVELINPSDGIAYWYLRVKAGGYTPPWPSTDYGRYIRGQARCFSREQRL